MWRGIINDVSAVAAAAMMIFDEAIRERRGGTHLKVFFRQTERERERER